MDFTGASSSVVSAIAQSPLKRMTRGSSMLSETPEKEKAKEKEKEKEIVSVAHFPLPRYIIHYIFCYLTRKELATCHSVAKLWRLVASEATFAWLDVLTMSIEGTTWKSSNTATFLAPSGGKVLDLHSAEFILRQDWRENSKVKFYSKSGETIGVVEEPYSYNTMRGPNLANLINEGMKDKNLWRIELRAHPKGHVLLFEIFIPRLEKLALEEQPIPNLSIILDWVALKAKSAISSKLAPIDLDAVRIPMKMVVPQKQPMGLVPSLYKYQLDAVNWMKSVEEDADIGFVDLMPIHPRAGVLFDLRNEKCISTKKLDTHKKVTPRGAIMADEMGLGKTTEMISLILANPGDPSQIDPKNFSQPREISAEHSVIEPADVFNTNATLVIVPSHLLKQWHEEIEKTTKVSLNILCFTNIRDIRNCTYGDIISADIVIVSHQMLANTNYFNMGMQNGLDNPMYASSLKSRAGRIKNYLQVVSRSASILKQKAPVFEHFNWWRIVVDEAHEIIDDDYYAETFANYKSNFWWYVTGTPFPTVKTQTNLIKFLRFPIITKTSPKPDTQELIYKDIYLNNLCWRNTKKSVENEYEVPPIVEDLRLLNFTNIEKLLYADTQYNFSDSLPEVCCGAAVCKGYDKVLPDRPALADIRTSLMSLIESRIAEYKANVKQLEQKLIDYAKELIEAKAVHEKRRVEFEKVEAKEPTSTLFKSKEYYTAQSRMNSARAQIGTVEQKIANAKGSIVLNNQKRVYNENLFKQFKDTAPSSYDGPDMSKMANLPKPVQEIANESEEKKEKISNNNNATEAKPSDPLSSWSLILDLNIAQLKEELIKRGVKPNSKHRKTDLQKALKEAVKKVKDSASAEEPPKEKETEKEKAKEDEEEEEEEEEKPKAKGKGRGRGKKAAARGKRKQAPTSDETDEVETKKPRKEAENSKDSTTPRKKTIQDKIDEQNLLKWMVEKEGTKLGNLMAYLKQLWEENPSVKIIIFSQFSRVLEQISILLEEKEIDYSLVEGNATKRNKRLNAFKARDSSMHVLLLNIHLAASGTNIVEASHIILMEPIQTSDAQATEAQAIARAHRQGQTSQVTVTRFVVRETKEYEAYVQHYGKSALPEENEDEIFISEQSHSGRPKMQRTSSLITTPIKFELPIDETDANTSNNNNESESK